MSRLRPASITIALVALGCTHQETARPHVPVAPLSVDDSALCGRMAQRFVGLPAFAAGGEGGSPRPTPLVGRWWLRACSATRENGDLRVRLRGPGWYFVDKNDGGLAVRQQVPFDLSIELDGRLNTATSKGILSMWFVPDMDPKVDLRVSGNLRVRPTSAWGALLSMMPLVSVRAMAADQFTETATDALRLKLREGATLTYDFGEGQADAALGRLGAGQSPVNAFQDRVPWLVNERLSLGPSAIHVVGPIDPGPTRLDVVVERGAGVAYRALCVQDMASDYAALASGHAEATSMDPRMARGTVAGQGKHTSDFRVDGCKFYLVISALESANTVVSLRIRA